MSLTCVRMTPAHHACAASVGGHVLIACFHRGSRFVSFSLRPLLATLSHYAHTHTPTHTHTLVPTFTHSNKHTNIQTHTHTYIHTYTHTHIHAHRLQVWSSCVCRFACLSDHLPGALVAVVVAADAVAVAVAVAFALVVAVIVVFLLLLLLLFLR